MPKISNAFRWIYGIIVKKPTRFNWLIEERLAGSDVPLTFSQYRWLLKQGIQTIVTVKEKPLPAKCINQNITTRNNNSDSRQKINYFHLKVKDKDVPAVEQLDNMVDYINNQINEENRPVAVHC